MSDKDSKELATVSTDSQAYNWVGMNPRQIQNVSKVMAMSGMFPDIIKDQAKAYVKIMAGQEMGIPPFQAMSDISIIQGKAAAGGNIYASKVKAHPKYDYKVKSWERTGCAIEFFQLVGNSKESIGVSSFDEQDAQAAGLLSKESWKKYPRNMYFNRAMTAGVRTFCPDALNGINAYTPEELGEQNVDEDGRIVVASHATFPNPAPRPQPQPEQQSPAWTADEQPADDLPVQELASAQTSPEAAEEPVVALTEQPDKYRMLEFKRPNNEHFIHPTLRSKIKEFRDALGMTEADLATWSMNVISAPEPKTFDQAMALLEAMVYELNEDLERKETNQESTEDGNDTKIRV